MKQISFLVAMLICSATFAQGSMGKNQNPTDAGSANKAAPVQTLRCCPKIYVSTPATTPGGKAKMRLLASKAFKGRQQGTDLSFDVLDAKGKVVEGLSDVITTNAAGDVVVDASKLPAGKHRLRAKAGKATETYTIN
jgi:hypothetical protein